MPMFRENHHKTKNYHNSTPDCQFSMVFAPKCIEVRSGADPEVT